VRLWRQGHRLLPILDSPTQAGYIAVLSNTTPTVYAHRGTMSMDIGKITRVVGWRVVHHSTNLFSQDEITAVRHYFLVNRVVDKISTVI
jgi:hypothetical protein